MRRFTDKVRDIGTRRGMANKDIVKKMRIDRTFLCKRFIVANV
jgi:hypothetical protein